MRNHVGMARHHDLTSSETATLTEYLVTPNPGSASPIKIALLASNRPLPTRPRRDAPQPGNEVGRPAGAERNRVEAADGVGVT
jgi:hypothetical protein